MEQNGDRETRVSGEVLHGLCQAEVAGGSHGGEERRAQEGQRAGGVGVVRAAAVFKTHRIPQPVDVVFHRPVPADEFGEAGGAGLAAARERTSRSRKAADVMTRSGFFDAALFMGHFAFGAHYALGVGKTDALAADGFGGQLALDDFTVAAFRGADKKGVPSNWLCA